MKTLYILLMFAITLGLLQACSPAESANVIPTADAPIPVQVITLQKEEITQKVICSGQFSTDEETTLAFKTGGILQAVLVKEGDYVRKGQLLATLDLTEIEAGVSQAELAYQKAERDYMRTENLYRDSVATLEQYQNAQTALSLSQEQLKAVKFNLNYSEIRATTDGYVLKKFANAGQMTSSGDPMIRINGAGGSAWIFETRMSDKEWAVVQIGDSATILTDAMPGQLVQARVVRKSEGADPINGAFTVELIVQADKQTKLATGLFGTATILPVKKAKAWRIPYEALLDGNANQGFVFVTSDNKKVRRVPVTIAAIDDDVIYISGGLENATALITRGSAYLKDESAITIVKK